MKVETANPLRSFKGRGADFLMRRFGAGQTVVCSSTGNFGQAMAYTGRRRGVAVEVFVPENVNPLKLARMHSFGARVTAVGADSAASEAAARARVAATKGCVYVEDGKEPTIAEGAGTIGVELISAGPFDTVVLPVGDGALISGVGRWIKEQAPHTRIVGVCARGAPCMAMSWRARMPVATERSDTIAEGIEVRVPVPSGQRLRSRVGRRRESLWSAWSPWWTTWSWSTTVICWRRCSCRPRPSASCWSRQEPQALRPSGFTICREIGWLRS